MNNAQKANEIAEKYSFEYDDLGFKYEFYDSALEMAKWKDKQFIKFLEDRMGDEILWKTIEEFKEMVNG